MNEPDVGTFIELTGVSRQEARARLRHHHGNLERAMNDFFENPGSQEYLADATWDESAFSAPREGDDAQQGPTFKVDGPPEYDGYQGTSHRQEWPGLTAGSRPPSRTSNRSPMQGGIETLEGELSSVQSSARMTRSTGPDRSTWTEDQELERAIQESARDAGVLAPQQYGVEHNEKYFGPVSQPSAYHDDWNMVHVPQQSIEEIDIRPEPSTRKREVGSPAFLKPTTQQTHLGALLTILHGIPMAREQFLDRANVLPDYGYDKDWWDGTPISMDEAIPSYSEVESASSAVTPQATQPALLVEVQRLMAFLDSTERSYGSADALYRLVSKYRQRYNNDYIATFYQKWSELCKDEESSFMCSQGIEPPDDADGSPNVQVFSCLDVILPGPTDATPVGSLYDLLDNLMCPHANTEMDSEETSPWISKLGEVFTFQLRGRLSSRAFEIPTTWYPDRYLLAHQSEAHEMRQRKRQLQEEMVAAAHQQHRLTDFVTQSGKSSKVADILDAAIKAATTPVHVKDELDKLPGPDFPDSGPDTLVAELTKVVANVDRKLQELQRERARLTSSWNELSSLLTGQSEPPGLHRYSLRGFSASREITYVRRASEPSFMDMALSDGTTDAATDMDQKDQWWRLAFDSTSDSAKPADVQRVSEMDIEAILSSPDTIDPILIYASERAMVVQSQPLPQPLLNFVQLDNSTFAKEFPEEAASESATSPRSPGKRKRGDGDDGSSSPAGHGPERELSGSVGSVAGNLPATQDVAGDVVMAGMDDSRAWNAVGGTASLEMGNGGDGKVQYEQVHDAEPSRDGIPDGFPNEI